jgi:gluconolactonase
VFLLDSVFAHAQDFAHVEVQKLAKDLHYADGPVWSWEGYMLYSDAPVNMIRKFVPGTGDVEVGIHEGGAYGHAYDKDGRLYTCEFRQRRVTRAGKSGIEVLAARFEGKRFNAPNDLVIRRDGHLWFTDPAFGNQADGRELDFYGVFHVSPKGEIEAVARMKTRPNGIALGPAGKILYVADADARLIRAWDIDKNGAASNARVFVDKITGVPGGVRTDEKGNVYVAGNYVYLYSPQGEFIRKIELGETPSNLCFGDADLETLYITAQTSVYRLRMGVKGASY